jgi:hypothetical protein
MKEVKELVGMVKGLVAGATNFSNFGRGTDAKKVFGDLVERYKHEDGHGGYTGTIAEKGSYGFKMVAQPMPMDAAHKLADTMIDDADKWGPAFCIPITGTGAEKVIDIEEVEYARTSTEAEQLMRKELDEKYKAKGLLWTSVDRFSIAVEKSSDVSLKVRTKQKPIIHFKYVVGWSDKVFFDIRSAVESLKTDIDALQASGKDLPKEIAIQAVIHNNPTILFDVVHRSQKGNKYRLRGKIKLMKPSNQIIGYYFFGFASE